jgi:predicted nucleic acid-binding protein
VSREDCNIVISRFLKDVLDRFAITSVNDEPVASANPLAVKHALTSADCLQLASAICLKKGLESTKENLFLCAQIETYAEQLRKRL